MSNPETNLNTQNSKLSVLEICISKIRTCSEFHLPARSRFGEGRDFVLRIYYLILL
jgi:hypothetical protein